MTADMLCAYYSKGCDSRELFQPYTISSCSTFEKYINQYDVIHIDVQWCKDQVENINDICVRTLLTQSLERTTIKRAKGRKSKYSASEKTVYLAENAKVDTLAHELFHEIDDAYGLIENGLLSKSVISDYNKLQNLAKGYGKSIKEMLRI